jgi:hypothetical protein
VGYHIIIRIYGFFPSRKIEIVSGGIRAILDPRIRPVELNTSLEAKQPVWKRALEVGT